MTLRFARVATHPAALVILAIVLSACQQQGTQAVPDDAAIRQEIQQLTEDLYWIHLRLDTARNSLNRAEQSLAGGEASAAAFEVDEARRALEKADDRVLELGLELQQTFDLDRKLGPQ